MLTKKKSAIAAVLLAVPLLFGALTACSSADSDSGSEKTPSPGTNAKTFDTFEEYQLAFSQCMRDKGIDMGDPDDGGLEITQNEGFIEAAEACQSESGQPPTRDDDSGSGSENSDAVRQEHLKIAGCLRERGVDVPDPAPGQDLTIPSDVPVDAFEECAPNGFMGSTTGGN